MDVSIEAIKKLYDEGLSQEAIGCKLGCSQWLISNRMRNSDLPRRDKTLRIREHMESIRKKINDDFFDEINEESAWLLGFVLSDGSIKGNRISFYLSAKDTDTLETIKKMLNYEGSLRTRTTMIGTKTYTGIVLEFTSKQIVDRLKDLGITENKTLKEKIPPAIFSEDEHLQKAFIRGVFDGDGSVVEYKHSNQKNQIVFQVVGTRELLNGLRKMLTCHVVCNKGSLAKNTKNDVNHFALRYVGNIQAANILKWLYEDAKVFMKRKHVKYTEMQKRLRLCEE